MLYRAQGGRAWRFPIASAIRTKSEHRVGSGFPPATQVSVYQSISIRIASSVSPRTQVSQALESSPNIFSGPPDTARNRLAKDCIPLILHRCTSLPMPSPPPFFPKKRNDFAGLFSIFEKVVRGISGGKLITWGCAVFANYNAGRR